MQVAGRCLLICIGVCEVLMSAASICLLVQLEPRVGPRAWARGKPQTRGVAKGCCPLDRHQHRRGCGRRCCNLFGVVRLEFRGHVTRLVLGCLSASEFDL